MARGYTAASRVFASARECSRESLASRFAAQHFTRGTTSAVSRAGSQTVAASSHPHEEETMRMAGWTSTHRTRRIALGFLPIAAITLGLGEVQMSHAGTTNGVKNVVLVH